MKVVVTGASGHLGVNLIDELLTEGHQVTALVRHAPRIGLFPHAAQQRVVDLDDRASLRRAIQGVDVVYHLAGRISLSEHASEFVWRANVGGTRAIARAAVLEGVSKFVFCSSVHALDDRMRPEFPLDDTLPLWDRAAPCPIYHRSKAESERVALEVAKDGLDVTIVRPTGVVGGRDPGPSPMGRTLLEVAHGNLFAMTTGGFDFIDARDLARTMVRAAALRLPARSYLVSGHFVSLVELFRLAANIREVRPPAFVIPYSWVRPFAPLSEALSVLLGVEPRFSRQALDTVARGRIVDSTPARRDLGHETRPLSVTLRELYDYFEARGLC